MIWFRLLSRLPFPALYGVADLLYLLGYYVAGYRRKVIAANIAKAFPEKSPAWQQETIRLFYRNLADIIVETLKLLTIPEKELRKRVQIRNPEVLLHHLNRGQSIIVMTAHQGNWEWLLQGCALYLDYDVDAVYRPLQNQFFNQLMLDIRSRFGPFPVPMQQLPRELISRRPVVRIIAMVADQAPAPEMAHWLTFLNQDTPFFMGAAKIAMRTGYPVLFTWMRRVRRGYYEVEMAPVAVPPYPSDAVEKITGHYAATVESIIRQRPAEWLWSHKRWKHRR